MTPLRRGEIAGYDVLVKDESARMGLGSFKALGGAYAASQLIAQAGMSDIITRIRAGWDEQLRIIVVEPDAAPCLRDSMVVGTCVTVEGPVSDMGRLDCKSPSMLAFEILRTGADAFVTVSEGQAQDAATQLTQAGLPATPSGGAGFAGLLADAQRALHPLIILSEGSTA